MTQKIDLPNGWAELRSPEQVPVRLRRPVERALMAVGRGKAIKALEAAAKSGINDPEAIAEMVDEELIEKFYDLNDLLVVARVAAWSFDKPITLENVLDLPEADYSALLVVASVGVEQMVPNFDAMKGGDSPKDSSSD